MDKTPPTRKNEKLRPSDEAKLDNKTDAADDEAAQETSHPIVNDATPEPEVPLDAASKTKNPLEIPEIVNKIAQYLDKESKRAFAATSRLFHEASQPRELAHRCAVWTAQADEKKVQQLITMSPSYISYVTIKTKFKDPAGKEFNCSAFQYTLWALDWHMWNMMLTALKEAEEKAIPKAEWDATSEEARRRKPYLCCITEEEIRAIKVELFKQYLEVVEKGLDYTITRYQRVLDAEGKYQLVEPRVVEVKGESHFDLRGPEFCLMPQSPDFTPKKGKLYVQIEGNSLLYRVIALSGKAVGGRINLAALQCPLDQLNEIALLKPYFHRILKITAERDHTHPQALSSAFETYARELENDLDHNQIDSLWCSGVGMAEREIPAIIAQEICRKDVLLCAQTRNCFEETDFPRTIKYYYYNSISKSISIEPWFPPADKDNRLGLDFGIINWQCKPGLHTSVRMTPTDKQQIIRNQHGLSSLNRMREISTLALYHPLCLAAEPKTSDAAQSPRMK